MAVAEVFDIRWTSERSLCIRGPARPFAIADTLRGVGGVLDAVPTESEVGVTLDPGVDVDPASITAGLRGLGEPAPRRSTVHEIPVCYEPPHAPDLEEVARSVGMTPGQVAELHASTEFEVAFLGFAPGFGYLAGLPERLRVPRLASPRTRVEAGSVGIAGGYAGVYALPGPGGWCIIGRTSVALFDARRDPPALLRAGDRVRFRPVTERELRA